MMGVGRGMQGMAVSSLWQALTARQQINQVIQKAMALVNQARASHLRQALTALVAGSPTLAMTTNQQMVLEAGEGVELPWAGFQMKTTRIRHGCPLK